MASINFKGAEQFRKSGAVADLAGDDLILTVTAAEADNKQIFIGKVTGSCDVAGLLSIVDTSATPKIIAKFHYAAGGIVALNLKDFDTESDFATPTKDLVVKWEGDATPTVIYIDIVAYAFTGN